MHCTTDLTDSILLLLLSPIGSTSHAHVGQLQDPESCGTFYRDDDTVVGVLVGTHPPFIFKLDTTIQHTPMTGFKKLPFGRESFKFLKFLGPTATLTISVWLVDCF